MARQLLLLVSKLLVVRAGVPAESCLPRYVLQSFFPISLRVFLIVSLALALEKGLKGFPMS